MLLHQFSIDSQAVACILHTRPDWHAKRLERFREQLLSTVISFLEGFFAGKATAPSHSYFTVGVSIYVVSLLEVHSVLAMTSEREQLLHGNSLQTSRTGQETEGGYGATTGIHASLEAQRRAFREQDAQLEELSGGVSGIRNVAGLLSAEVTKQNKLLDDVVGDVESADAKTKAAVSRTAATERSPYSISNFCMLLWPLVLLILFIIFGLKHLLFG